MVDGRSRELACRVAGIGPEYVTEEMTEEEAEAFVLSRNARRRHLTPSQLAMAAARRAQGRPAKTGNVAGIPTQAEAAEEHHVSERTVRTAAKVLNKAPELVGAVRDGKLDVKTAAKAAALPKKDRERIAAATDPKKAAVRPVVLRPGGRIVRSPD